jgi:hypothetical protein
VGFLDEAKKKLGDAVDTHGERISQALDKAAHVVDEPTGGRRDGLPTSSTPTAPAGPNEPDNDPAPPTGPTGPSDPTEPTEPTEPAAPTGPMGATGGDPHPVPTDPSPVPPAPGSDPNEDSALGRRPVMSGGAR